ADVEYDLTQVVDPMGMIGMGVGIGDGVKLGHAGIKQLRHQIAARVDQQPRGAFLASTLDQQRAAAPPVARIIRVALAPAIAQPRHPARGTAAKGRGPDHATALLNSRSKFCEVRRANSASVIPRRSAPTFAVWTT